MKIISKFKDYYDGAQAYGQDSNLIYNRFTDDNFIPPVDIQNKLRALLFLIPNGYHYNDYCDQVGLIGFCGNLYPVWFVVNQWLATEDSIQRHLESKCDHQKKYLDSFWPSDPISQAKIIKLSKEPLYNWAGRIDPGFPTKPRVATCRTNHRFKNHLEIFTILGFPVFFYTYYRGQDYFIKDPKLKFYNFASVFDPWTAYQELSMFLGGVLPRNNVNTVDITDDKVIRDAKGHGDDSFKMSSPGKKARRRAKKNS